MTSTTRVHWTPCDGTPALGRRLHSPRSGRPLNVPWAWFRQLFLVDRQHGLAVHATVEQRLDRTSGVRPGRDEIDLGI